MDWGYSQYDGRAEKLKVLRNIERRRERGEKFERVVAPAGSAKLVKTFWAKSWCQHLEAHSDYEYRLPRGRSYLRQGNVYNLAIESGRVTSLVAGTSFYEVEVTIQPLPSAAWAQIKTECAGQVASLLDLLSGRLGDGVLRTISDPDRGLFPTPREIRFLCTCPDYAGLCKHVAATLYGVGVQLETNPDLFFVLRSVDPSELLSGAAKETLAQVGGADIALEGEDLSALFGIDLAQIAEAQPAEAPQANPAGKRAPKAASATPPVKKRSKVSKK